MEYRASFYTLSDCHQESEIEAADRAALMAHLENLMIDLSAPYTIQEITKPMTTPTQPAPVTSQVQQAAERFREELRADIAEIMDELKSQRAELINVRADLDAIRAGLTQASQPAPAVGTFETMDAVKIIRTKSKGKWYYKMQGGQYIKNGVTIWEEVLDLLNLDPATIAWSEEDTFKFPEPIRVKMQIKTYTDESGTEKQTPQKVTGRA